MTTQDTPALSGVGLCLSGGGFRAALFHLGALRRLNDSGVLPRLATVSSVSGGSIASGLLAAVWPSLRADARGRFENFDSVYEASLRAFCRGDRRTGPLLTERLNPLHWPQLASGDQSATNLLADVYVEALVSDLRLQHLEAVAASGGPTFIINACNLQTGANFTFSGARVGDWRLGYAHLPELRLADAIAASSAFPGAFPPLVLHVPEGALSGGALAESPEHAAIAARVLLTDGGVYDNLGLEPVWKRHAVILCSDGGKPAKVDPDPGVSMIPRLLRVQSIMGEQAIALRKRWLIDRLERGVAQGTYWGIGTDIAGYATREPGFRGEALALLRRVRTDLNAFSDPLQEVLINHGWLLADAALRTYTPALAQVAPPRSSPPFPERMSMEAVREALAD